MEALIDANYINFNLNGLNIIKGNSGRFYNVEDFQMSGQEISVQLPGEDESILLYVDNVQNLIQGEDVATYSGHASEDTANFFTFSIFDEGIMGKINYGEYLYVIMPHEGTANKHTIAKLEKALMVKDTLEQDPIESQAKSLLNHLEKSGGSGSGRVDILFYYGTDVTSPTLLVSGIVSEMNSILANSGVSSNNEIYSVGVLSTGTTFPGVCKNEVLFDYMVDRQGPFTNIDQEMNLYGADLAFTILGDLSATGCFAGQPGRVGGQAADYNNPIHPFAVTAQAYVLGDLTAPHEIGHIFGGKHSNLSVSPNGTPASARGKTFTIPCTGLCKNKPKQTIMGGYDSSPCTYTGLNFACERIRYFSKPNVSYSGVATGDSTRNMKSWLETNMSVVSAWRGAPIPPPIAPNPISVQSDSCYGFNTVTWASVNAATDYRLYKSTSSSFTNPVLLYSGTSTNTGINVNSGTWYLRAQACNSSGCSLNSSQVSASIYNGCQ